MFSESLNLTALTCLCKNFTELTRFGGIGEGAGLYRSRFRRFVSKPAEPEAEEDWRVRFGDRSKALGLAPGEAGNRPGRGVENVAVAAR